MESNTNNQNLTPVDRVIQYLSDFLSGDNQKIPEATQFLKQYTKLIESVGPLLQIMIQANDVGFRQLSAILLKKNITTQYIDLGPEERKEFRNAILLRYFEEPVSLVRRAIANLIAVLTKVALANDDWTELMVVLSEKTQPTQNLLTRSMGLILLGLILDISGEYLDKNYTDLYVFLSQTINDQSQEIRIATLKCVVHMFDSISEKDHIEMFQSLVEPTLKVLNECITLKDEETALVTFDVYCLLAESESPVLTDDGIVKIISFICTERVLMNEDLGANVRECAIDFLATVASTHKSILTKNLTLLRHVIDCIFIAACNKTKQEEFDDLETIQDIAMLLIRSFSGDLPKKKTWPIFKENVRILMDSEDPKKIESGLLVLANISEGCCEYMKRDLNKPIMHEYIANSLKSDNADVRSAAIYAICYFAEFLLPDILLYHKLIIPSLVDNFNTISPKVSERAIFTIDLFSENMEKDITEYLDGLVPKLFGTLDNANSTMVMRRLCISAISSIVSAAEEKFLPYVEITIKLMTELLKIKDISLIALRAEATSCLGKIVTSICKTNQEIFTNYIYPLIDVVYDGLVNLDDYEIREHSFEFFYHTAHVLGANFEPLLEKIITFIFKSIESDDGLRKIKEKKEFSLDSDSDDELTPGAGVHVQQPVMDEKSAAIHALGEFAQACPKGFSPYYQRALGCLDNLAVFFYANVRMQVVVCYKNLTEALIKVAHEGQLPQYQQGLPCVVRFPEKIEEFIKIELHTKLFYFLKEDDSKEVVASTLEAIQDLVKDLGPAVIDRGLDELVESIIMLLKNEAICQGTNEDSDDADVDGLIFGNITELIPIIAKSFRDGFPPVFKELYKPLKVFAKPNRGLDDIAQVIGVFAECFKYVPSMIPYYNADLIDLLLATKEHSDDEINRNVAFCYGVLCEFGGESMHQYYVTIMEHLYLIFQNAEVPEASDNAVAALAKMICANLSLIPLNAVLPVVFKAIPLKGDVEEEKTIIKMILFLFDTNVQALNGFEDISIGVLIDGLVQALKYKLTEELAQASVIVLKKLTGDENCKKIIQNYAAKLPQDQLIALENLLK